jgi:hypothetical protein
MSEAWAGSTPPERVARAKDALRAAADELGLDAAGAEGPPDGGQSGVELVEILGDARVIVRLASDVAPGRRPALLFAIERRLKEALDPAVSVYLEEMADKNRIRRLVVKPGEVRG